MKAQEKPKQIIPTWLKRFGPIAISVLILYYYFHNQDWNQLYLAIQNANLPLAISAIFIPQIIYWFFGTLIVERHFRWFHGSFPFWDYFWVKGAIYILIFINPALGGGGQLLYQQRKANISWRKLMGILLFRVGLSYWIICLFMIPMTAVIHRHGLVEKVQINMYVWWGILIFGFVYLINAWMTWHHDTHFGISKLVVRNRETEFWTAFRLSTKKQWFLTVAMILPPFLLMFIGYYFVAIAFDVHVPFVLFIVLVPLMKMMMDLPFFFAGFGGATWAWTIFFGDFGTADSILALTLFLPFARGVCRAIIGLISLKPALNDVASLFRESKIKTEAAFKTT